MKRITFLTMLTALLVLWTIAVFAAVPHLINFQGVLKDANGQPVADGSYPVKFEIFTSVGPGGGCLWLENQAVATQGGAFSVILGSNGQGIPDSAFNAPDRWLAITVGNDPEISPRQRLVSVGYSYRVNSVDGATGGTIFGNTSIQSNLGVKGVLETQNVRVTNTPTDIVPVRVQGSAGQTANLMEIKNSAGLPLVSIGPGGDMDGLNSTWETGSFIDLNCNGMLNVNGPVVVQGDAGQSANLQEWRISTAGGGSSTAAVVDANGNVGIGTGIPHSPLQVNGAFALAVSTYPCRGNLSLNGGHCVVIMEGTEADSCHVFLPSAAGIKGRQYTVKVKNAPLNPALVLIVPILGQTIDGNLYYTLSVPNQYAIVVSDGSNWWIIGKN